jgi:dephospho-CoA kinase
VGLVVFGLTGGFATGKSSVAKRWRERGLSIIDADEIARDVVAPGSATLAEVSAAFGPDIVLPDGSLDRKQMAALVFSDASARIKLEAITHPRIAAASQARARELADRGEPLACYEATLLVERGLADSFRPLVVVSAPEEEQVARAIVRDGVSNEEARARIEAQLPAREKEAVADYVIRNDRDRAWLLAQADRVLDAICKTAGVDGARFTR